MKIRLSQLRKIIREVLDQEADIPGHYMPRSGEPLSHDELDSMSHAGMGIPDDSDYIEELDENDDEITNQ